MNLILGQNETCYKLALFLQEGLNRLYQEERTFNPSLPNIIVVRSIRNYDAIGVPLSEFPLLKVYKNGDTFKQQSIYRTCNATITYNLSYAEIDQLPDLMSWVSWKINYLIAEENETSKANFPSKTRFQTPVNTQYMIGVNEQSNAVIPFLRIPITYNDYLIVDHENR